MLRAASGFPPEPAIETVSTAVPHRRYSRQQRLLRAREFKRVFDQHCRISRGGLTLLARVNNCDGPRLGLVISRKCARSAVARNRIKRLVRESFRLHQHRLGHWDLIVMGRAGVEQRSNSDLTASLWQLWVKLEKCVPS